VGWGGGGGEGEEEDTFDAAPVARPGAPPRVGRRPPPPVVLRNQGGHPGLRGSSIKIRSAGERLRLQMDIRMQSEGRGEMGAIAEDWREGGRAAPLVGAHPGLARGSSVKVMGYGAPPRPGDEDRPPPPAMDAIGEDEAEGSEGGEGEGEGEGEGPVPGPEPCAEPSRGRPSSRGSSRAPSVASSFQGDAGEITATYRKIVRGPGSLRQLLASTQPRRGPASLPASLAATLRRTAPSGFLPLRAPGPGTYEVRGRSRTGTAAGAAHAFERSGRVLDKVLLAKCHSPGPVYRPASVDVLATHQREPAVAFPKQGVLSRYDYHAGQEDNMPHFNPGPGKYEQGRDRRGGELIAGPRYSLRARAHARDDTRPHPVYVTPGHERERLGIHAPGPGTYDPEAAPGDGRGPLARFTLRSRGTTFFDEQVRRRAESTSSRFCSSLVDRRGGNTLGSGRATSFHRSQQREHVDENLSAAVYKTEAHARTEIYCLTGPGPVYDPRVPELHTPAPALNSGPPDRFYHRSGYLGQGRL